MIRIAGGGQRRIFNKPASWGVLTNSPAPNCQNGRTAPKPPGFQLPVFEKFAVATATNSKEAYTMDVILLERISGLGHLGDTVRVKDGFARNYLLPKGKALRANEANLKRFEAQRTEIEARNEERKSQAETISEDLDGKSFVVIRAAGETGQLYGSVSTRDIAELLTGQGFSVGRNQIDLRQPIKTIGISAVEIALHPEVEVTISLNVARSSDEAERQARGEDLTSAEAIYGEEPVEEAAPSPEEYFEPEAEFDLDESIATETAEESEEAEAEAEGEETPGTEESAEDDTKKDS